MTLAHRIEEAELNAVPALRQVLLNGWLLRFANGCTRRANAVTPLRPVSRLATRIQTCEALYAAQNQPTLFRIPSFTPPALSHALDGRAYAPPEGETRILHCPTLTHTPDPAVDLTPTATPSWLAAQTRIAGESPGVAQARRDMLAALAIPAAFAGIRLDGPRSPLVAMAYIAIHDRLACLNMVVTDPASRRRGLARRVITTLLAWSATAGATSACLQVAADNAAAQPLYAGLAFTHELYRYHYRRQTGPKP